MSTTVQDIRERERTRASLAYLMALDALDAAQARVAALAHKAKRGVFNEPMHLAALGNLERAVSELRRAEQHTRGMVEEGGPDAA
jgi:hypothetical protein